MPNGIYHYLYQMRETKSNSFVQISGMIVCHGITSL